MQSCVNFDKFEGFWKLGKLFLESLILLTVKVQELSNELVISINLSQAREFLTSSILLFPKRDGQTFILSLSLTVYNPR